MTTRVAQCGRTIVHLGHETDSGDGWCVGLEPTTVPDARTQRAQADARDAARQAVLR